MNTQTILVVEDNPVTRKMYRVALEINQYAVLEAHNGQTALTLLRENKVDLVLMDLGLSDINGNDLVNQIRLQSLRLDLPIIAISGRIRESTEVSKAFSAALSKPVPADRLLKAVRAHLMTSSTSETAQRGKKILIADDDPIPLKLLKVQLEQLGFAVETAVDGADALEKAALLQPDAIISDVLMPRVDGFRLCLKIRKDFRTARIPVFLISNVFIEESDLQLARTVGCNGFFPRQSDIQDLVNSVIAAIDAPHPEAPVHRGPATDQYFERIIGQIERQVGLNQRLTMQVALLEAQLSVLSRFASSPIDLPVHEDMLNVLLQTCFDAGGISLGAVFLLDKKGAFSLKASFGVQESSMEDLANLYGQSTLLMQALKLKGLLTVPSDLLTRDQAEHLLRSLNAGSIVMSTLIIDDEPGGVILITSSYTQLPEEWHMFASTLSKQIGHAIGLLRIIRKSREAQVQLLESTKLATLGQMAGNIAHEIKNPLHIILGKSRQLQDLLAADPPALDRACRHSSSISEMADRMTRIVDGLRTISRLSDDDPFMETRIADLIRDTIALCKGRFKYESIEFSIEELPQDLTIDCRGAEIGQVLLNLLNNACDAIESKPDKWIKLAVRDNNDWIEIMLMDSGSGIPAEIRDRMMQPFFTTKEVGRGTGLGLSISKSLVEAHGGHLLLDENCSNTCFILRLPRHQK